MAERWESLLTLASLLGLCALAWLALLHLMDGQMAAMSGAEMAVMALEQAQPKSWTANDLLLMLTMWIIMMVAMMLPSALPMILLYQKVVSPRGSVGSYESCVFTCAYLLIWVGFSLAATLAQWALAQGALLSPMLNVYQPSVGGAILLAAGLYQWLPLKQSCLTHCRSPLHFIMHHWQPGLAGAWRMGLRHGLYCLGCCWVLMALLFVFGVMNLFWIALLSAFVLLEKLLPYGDAFGKLTGVLLLAWGLHLLT